MYAELYEETLRFDEAALEASIQAYEEEEAAMPMQWGEDDEAANTLCPGCGRGQLEDAMCAANARSVPCCRCNVCPFAVMGTQTQGVLVAVRQAAMAHGSICNDVDLEWRVEGALSLSCRCRTCGATATKGFSV
jgi:hypothetical protein